MVFFEHYTRVASSFVASFLMDEFVNDRQLFMELMANVPEYHIKKIA
jgi:hypothetical protein